MRTVIVGGVAGGMSAATRLRRLDENCEILVFEKGSHVSFANCGLPYYAGGVIEKREDLLLQSPESLKARFNLDVHVNHEVIKILPSKNAIEVQNLSTGESEQVTYDNLVLSMGAAPFIPEMPGREHLLTLRNVADVDKLKKKIEVALNDGAKAIVIGAGFIGLEIVENLVNQGLSVTLIELTPNVLPPIDPDMSQFVLEGLQDHGVQVRLGQSVVSATENSVTLSDGETIYADLLFASIGVRPEVGIVSQAGISIGKKGGVVVDDELRTSMPNIFAVGDMVEKVDMQFGDSGLVALANLANKQGRRVADVIAGIKVNKRTNKALGTAVVKVFDNTIAMTGASERRLRSLDWKYFTVKTHPNDHAGYYPGAQEMHLVVHFDAKSGKILGAQGVGGRDVVKRIDVLATSIFSGLTAADLIDLELAYSPQYGSAKDAVNMIGYIAEGILNGLDSVVSLEEIEDALLLDVRTKEEFDMGTLPGAVNIDIDELRDRHTELDSSKEIVVFCQVGQRGHSAARLLKQLGYKVSNLNGGFRSVS
ncbi:MAG TPA: FAD-dependent oxidoreductase [Acidimicrobiia bacterium]|nr:FAD-dependent oxidoreductase [Acidimicrobiia bacterium]